MTDTLGRDSVKAYRDKTEFSINFKTGVIKESGKEPRHIKPGVPPIWIAGYENDIRLMISQNQGLFRRFRRLALKPPTTSDLYEELIKKTRKTLEELPQDDSAREGSCKVLLKQFRDHKDQIIKFFRWGGAAPELPVFREPRRSQRLP